MQWALIATIAQPLEIYMPPVGEGATGAPGHLETITVQPGTVVNLIVYDGISEYTAPDGTVLQQVPDTAIIGDTGYPVE